MKRISACGTLSLMAFTIAAGPLASAQDAGWYGGINAGQTRAKIDDARIISGLLAGRLATTSITDDDRDSGYKIFGGYQVNRNFAFEGGYFDLGKFGFSATTLPAGTFNGQIKVRGLNLDLVGMLPITERFSAFGRVGANYAEAKDTFSGTGLVRVLRSNAKVRDTNVKYGLGLQYAFNDRLGIRAEVERYRINDAVGNKGDIDLASVGLIFRFGAPRTVVAYAPRPMAPEPVAPSPSPRAAVPDPIATAPAPQPVAIPPPRQPMKVTFSADALFDFDKATLKPAGKQALDKFAADIRGTRYDVITVIGYADRIGSRAYNMKLSTARANSVKTYLVDPAGIAAGKITTRGADESNPVTKPGQCKGNKATKALIACLQPDRRVEVEVTATK